MIIDGDKLSQHVSARIEEDVKSNRVLGAGVYVFQNGKVLLDNEYGYKTADKKVKLNKSSMFRLASMTKPIIAVAVMKLIAAGKLDLFDRADKFIGGFNGFYIGKAENGIIVPDKKAVNSIRVLDLLTHTSGLGSGAIWDKQFALMGKEDKKDLSSAVEFYKSTFLAFEPYCGNAYSPTAAFDVLARIIEIISGKDIEEYLKEEIFIPLEMEDTVFTPSNKQWERLVDMHDFVNGGSVLADMKGSIFADFPVTYKCGGAGLVSTVKDYSHFALMLLSGGEYNGKRILPGNFVYSMGLSHIPEYISGKTEGWGLGVRVIKDGNRLPKGCFGWSGAYGTHFWIDPKNKLFAIYMKNSRYDGGSGAHTAAHFEEDVMNSV